jgi:acyl carrier protein
MSYRNRVREFIEETFLVGHIEEDESFMASGLIDSLGIMQLIGLVESVLARKVPDTDLVPENFDSIARISAYLERMRRAA